MNGCGKSSIIKAIMSDETSGKQIIGNISYCGGKNLLELSDAELQSFRAEVAYVPQRDDYESIGRRVRVIDILMDSAYAYNKKSITKKEVNDLFVKYDLRNGDAATNRKMFDEYSNPAKLSGGQQRMVSILSAVAVREDARLIIIDEPLNNLDFVNSKKISNLITKIHHEYPQSAILMVTHCRMFPCITRVISMENGKLLDDNGEYHCNSCFGKPDELGYYL
jgi:ABC-type glutathione transport system ATPase component